MDSSADQEEDNLRKKKSKSKKRVSFDLEEDERPLKKAKFEFDDDEDENLSSEETESSDDDLTKLNNAYITNGKANSNEITENKFEDSEEAEEESDEAADSPETEDDSEEESTTVAPNVKMISSVNAGETSSKSAATKQQKALYGRLFAARIALQKALTASHRLPAPATSANLPAACQTARRGAASAAIELLHSCLCLQQEVADRLPAEGRKLLQEGQVPKKGKEINLDPDDEEITSSEDEEETTSKSSLNTPKHSSKTHKKLTSLRDIEECLAKKHRAMAPYRDSVVDYWQGRARLLRGPTKKGAKGGGLRGLRGELQSGPGEGAQRPYPTARGHPTANPEPRQPAAGHWRQPWGGAQA